MSKPSLSRRELFSILRPRLPEQQRHVLAPGLRPPLRPPGAVSEQRMADQCTRCNKCVEVCPVEAILPLGEEYGPWAGTPHILPRNSPCVLCEGLLCTTVCPSSALRPVDPFGGVKLGQAVIDKERCVAHQGQFCDDCAQACPEGVAILFNFDGHPRIDGNACTGCGICEKVCPVEPSAICAYPFQREPAPPPAAPLPPSPDK